MLSTHLRDCGEHCFTGRLLISCPQGQKWSLLYKEGRVIGDGHGAHSLRRWRRQLSLHCAELETDVRLNLAQLSREGCDLETLLMQRGLQRSQITAVIEGSLSEIFFDIAQHQAQLEQQSLGSISIARESLATLSERTGSGTLVKAEFLWIKAQQRWQDWQQAGLGQYSPNLAIQIRHPEQLKQEVSELTYRKLSTLIDGRRTLRDLAVKLGQDVRLLTQSLSSFIQRDIMTFRQVADLGAEVEPITTISVSPVPESSRSINSPRQSAQRNALIACIDDSPFICKAVGDMILRAGYRFVAIQDSLQAVPTLLKHKPDMIFLDLVMPIANGYEVCTQIRRVARFKETPIVILTGQDGIFDRVRAKLVGSTDFLSKPVEAEKVTQMIERYVDMTSRATPAVSLPRPQSASFSLG